MATTAESIRDGLFWLGKLGRVFLKRGLIVGGVIGLFAVAIWATGGDGFDDCDADTAGQRAIVDSFREPSGDRNFRVDSDVVCWDGAMVAEAVGPAGDIDDVIEQLRSEGWEAAANLWPPEHDLRVVCFRSEDERLRETELNVASSRSGIVGGAELRITPGHRACEPFSCRSIAAGCQRWDRLDFPT